MHAFANDGESVPESVVRELQLVLNGAHQRNVSSAVVFRLLLAVSLWRGPLLWAHDHTTADADLTTHLSVFHPDEPNPWHLGWHWHFSLPDNRGPLSPGGHEPLDDTGDSMPVLMPGAVVSGAAGLSSSADQSAMAAFLPPRDCHVPSPSEVEVARIGNRLASGTSMQQLLCRMNC